MPEFDREGWAVSLFWLQGGKHDEAPTDKKSRLLELPWATFRLPSLFEKRGTNRIPELTA